MNARTFALAIGLVFLAVGVLGFLPGPHAHLPVGAPDLAVDSQYVYLFGLFPVNVLHNLVHLVVGGLGLLAYWRPGAAVSYSRGLAIFYGILAVMGLVPGLDTTFGLIPIFGHDVWLHAGTAAAAAYFGWAGERAGRPMRPAHRHA
jgi:hypothetical protein